MKGYMIITWSKMGFNVSPIFMSPDKAKKYMSTLEKGLKSSQTPFIVVREIV